MIADKLYTSLTVVKLTNNFQRTKLITPSTDKHYSPDSEDDFAQAAETSVTSSSFPPPGQSHYTK